MANSIQLCVVIFTLSAHAYYSYCGLKTCEQMDPYTPAFTELPQQSSDFVTEVGRHPDTTSRATFNYTYNGQVETWGLRVNKTQFPISNNQYDKRTTKFVQPQSGDYFGKDPLGNFSENLRTVNIQYELQWPGDGSQTLEALMRERGISLSFFTGVQPLTSDGVKKFNSSDNGNCSSMLGSECVPRFPPFDAGPPSLYRNDTEGIFLPGALTASFSFRLREYPSQEQLYPGDTLWYDMKPSFPATNQSTWDEAVNSLHYFSIGFYHEPHETAVDGKLLCQVARRVDQSSTPSTSSSGPTNSPSGSASSLRTVREGWQQWSSTLKSVVFPILTIMVYAW